MATRDVSEDMLAELSLLDVRCMTRRESRHMVRQADPGHVVQIYR